MEWNEMNDHKQFEALVKFNADNGFPLLHYYCKKNDLKRSQFLLDLGINPNLCIEYGVNDEVTPLMISSQFNSLSAVKLLLKYDVDINLSNSQGSTALHYAMYNDSPELVSALLEAGADVNVFTCERALWTIEFDSFLFETPLHLAASSNYLDVAKLLIKAGADINAKSCSERTPLMFASAFGCLETLEYLCSQGADINCRANQKTYGITTDYSALHFAAKNGYQDAYDTLIRYGANEKAIECNTGMTAKEMLKRFYTEQSKANSLLFHDEPTKHL